MWKRVKFTPWFPTLYWVMYQNCSASISMCSAKSAFYQLKKKWIIPLYNISLKSVKFTVFRGWFTSRRKKSWNFQGKHIFHMKIDSLLNITSPRILFAEQEEVSAKYWRHISPSAKTREKAKKLKFRAHVSVWNYQWCRNETKFISFPVKKGCEVRTNFKIALDSDKCVQNFNRLYFNNFYDTFGIRTFLLLLEVTQCQIVDKKTKTIVTYFHFPINRSWNIFWCF